MAAFTERAGPSLTAEQVGKVVLDLAAGGDGAAPGAYLLTASRPQPGPVTGDGGRLQSLTAAMICGGPFDAARARAAPKAFRARSSAACCSRIAAASECADELLASRTPGSSPAS